MKFFAAVRFLGALLLAVTVAGTVSAAVPTFYNSQAAFNIAAGATSSFGFNSLVSGSSSVLYNTAAGLTLSGFNFVGTTNTGTTYFLAAAGPNYFGTAYNVVPGQSSLQSPALTSPTYSITNGKLTINMPGSGVTAFGILFFDVLAGSTTPAGSGDPRQTVPAKATPLANVS